VIHVLEARVVVEFFGPRVLHHCLCLIPVELEAIMPIASHLIDGKEGVSLVLPVKHLFVIGCHCVQQHDLTHLAWLHLVELLYPIGHFVFRVAIVHDYPRVLTCFFDASCHIEGVAAVTHDRLFRDEALLENLPLELVLFGDYGSDQVLPIVWLCAVCPIYGFVRVPTFLGGSAPVIVAGRHDAV